MKRRWRIAILALVVLVVVAGAGAAWLGMLPFARPTTEPDFMAEQLRRVRYQPFSTEHEKAIAANLPDDPTTDDLRMAFERYRRALWADAARSFIEANPQLVDPAFPPADKDARIAYGKACKQASELDQRYDLQRIDIAAPGIAEADRNEFLAHSEAVMHLLANSIPAKGKTLLTWAPDTPLGFDIPDNSMAPLRVGIVRVHCQVAAGAADDACASLGALADFASETQWSPCLLGLLWYVLANEVVYQKGVEPLAQRRFLPLDLLARLGDRRRLLTVDVAQIARKDGVAGIHTLARAGAHIAPELELAIARDACKESFHTYGATSLNDWVRQCLTDIEVTLTETLRPWPESAPVDFRDAERAKESFEQIQSDENVGLHDRANLVAQIATAMLETEAWTLAARIYQLQARSPETWLDDSIALSPEYPMLAMSHSDNTIEIRPNMAHYTVRASARSVSDRVLATVR